MHDANAINLDAAREPQRLRALKRYGILDTGREASFDELTHLTARTCGTPLALLGFVDEGRVWFKAVYGTAAESCARLGSLCSEAIAGEGPFVVTDTRLDERFASLAPLAPGEPVCRFYAGIPLRTAKGHAVGTLSILDHQPRMLEDHQLHSLQMLARQVMAQMEHRRAAVALRREARARARAEKDLRESQMRFRSFMNHGPAIAYIKDVEGRFLYVNEPLAERFERPVEQWIGRRDADIIGPEAAQAIEEHDLTVFNTEQMVVTQEIAATPDGQSRFWLSYKFLLRDADGQKCLGGMSFDISERKATESAHERLIAELRDALAQVKTLSGFLPICASCKKIRDDAGYWQQIEDYLSRHSGLEFTHGICPTCIEVLYPEFAARRLGEAEARG